MWYNTSVKRKDTAMRLDKYLKTARILKRRSVSKELADQQRVYVCGTLYPPTPCSPTHPLLFLIAKPSTEVKEGDLIKVLFGNRELTVRVLQLQKQANKNDAALMFEVVEETIIHNPTLSES